VLTSVNEYLPLLKRLFSRKTEVPAAPGIHWLQQLLQDSPPEAPAVTFDPRVDLAALPIPAAPPAGRRA